MTGKTGNDNSKETFRMELPLPFQLMDVFLKQIEQSAPVLIPMVKDMQTVYINGIHVLLKAGKSIENRSKTNLNLFKRAGYAVEIITPVFKEAQNQITKAVVEATIHNIIFLRKSITGGL